LEQARGFGLFDLEIAEINTPESIEDKEVGSGVQNRKCRNGIMTRPSSS